MRYLVRVLFCTWMLALTCICAYGQTHVHGQILNAGIPVSGAVVQLANPSTKQTLITLVEYVVRLRTRAAAASTTATA